MKYRPDFPEKFGSPEHARSHGKDFFAWYNHEQHQSALEMLTPTDVHHGLAEQRVAEKQKVLDAAYSAHPERFPRGAPKAKYPPREVWINKPNQPGTVDDDETPSDSRDASDVTGDQKSKNAA